MFITKALHHWACFLPCFLLTYTAGMQPCGGALTFQMFFESFELCILSNELGILLNRLGILLNELGTVVGELATKHSARISDIDNSQTYVFKSREISTSFFQVQDRSKFGKQIEGVNQHTLQGLH